MQALGRRLGLRPDVLAHFLSDFLADFLADFVDDFVADCFHCWENILYWCIDIGLSINFIRVANFSELELCFGVANFSECYLLSSDGVCRVLLATLYLSLYCLLAHWICKFLIVPTQKCLKVSVDLWYFCS